MEGLRDSIMNSKLETFLKEWLHGTTCHHQKRTVYWSSECQNYAILKHHGHTEYVDRVVGTARCSTYYILYDINEQMNYYGQAKYLKKWEGRWKNSYLDEALELIKEDK